MANDICICNAGLDNTGLPSCAKVAKVIKKIIFVPLYDNDGVANSIDPTDTLDNSWVTALLNNVDKSQRWFPTPEIKNIDTPKNDPVFEAYEDDSSNFVRESVRKFTGKIPITPPAFKAKLESVRCNAGTGMYWVDLEGNIHGLTNGADNLLYPIPFNEQSLVAKVVLANDKSTTGIDLMFEFKPSLNDANLRMIGAEAFTDFSLLSISGLLDGAQTISDISTTGFKTLVESPVYGALNNKVAITGLDVADFKSGTGVASKITNETDPSEVTITSVTEDEDTPGLYTVVFAAQTAADVLRCRIVKNGFEIASAAVTIPA